MPNNGAAANRRSTGQLDDFMKFDCQDSILESRSAAVAELGRSADYERCPVQLVKLTRIM